MCELATKCVCHAECMKVEVSVTFFLSNSLAPPSLYQLYYNTVERCYMLIPNILCCNVFMFPLQKDLEEVKAKFLEMYHKTLGKMIEGDCSGDYKRMLLAIVGQ